MKAIAKRVDSISYFLGTDEFRKLVEECQPLCDILLMEGLGGERPYHVRFVGGVEIGAIYCTLLHPPLGHVLDNACTGYWYIISDPTQAALTAYSRARRVAAALSHGGGSTHPPRVPSLREQEEAVRNIHATPCAKPAVEEDSRHVISGMEQISRWFKTARSMKDSGVVALIDEKLDGYAIDTFLRDMSGFRINLAGDSRSVVQKSIKTLLRTLVPFERISAERAALIASAVESLAAVMRYLREAI